MFKTQDLDVVVWAKISRIALLSPMYVNLRTANTVVGLTVGKKWKNIAIRNCWISVRGAIKLHPYGTSAEQIEACILEWCNFIPPQALSISIIEFFYSKSTTAHNGCCCQMSTQWSKTLGEEILSLYKKG